MKTEALMMKAADAARWTRCTSGTRTGAAMANALWLFTEATRARVEGRPSAIFTRAACQQAKRVLRIAEWEHDYAVGHGWCTC